ncbi:MAG: MATE family efflux transporter [Clostridia bacterium]|nr:MATE family efflux transporter [Clostridia bacterium]
MKAKSKNIDLTTGNIMSQMLKFFWPMLLGSLFQQLYTTVDAIIVGQFAGKAGLASIDAVSSMLRLAVNMFVGIGTGATVIISQYFGAKKEKELGKAIHTSAAFALIAGAAISIIGVCVARPALGLLGVPADIYGQSLGYVRVYFAGLIVLLCYNISAGISRAVGDSQTPFRALVVSGILNMILDYVFVAIFGWGAPGAGFATVISQAVSVVIVTASLMKNQDECRLELKKIKLDMPIFKEIMRIGFLMGIQSSLYPIANVIIQKSVNALGTDSIAAWALGLKLDTLIWLTYNTMNQTISTFVAQNYGAKQIKRAREGTRICLITTSAIILAFGAVLFFFCEPLGRLFLTAEDAYIAEMTAVLMHIQAFTYVTYAPTSVLSGAIRGAGESFMPMIMTLVGMCAVRIAWAFFVVPMNYTLPTIIWGYPVSWALTSVAFLLYYIPFSKRKFSE